VPSAARLVSSGEQLGAVKSIRRKDCGYLGRSVRSRKP
jgi:hypothetical protein